jgi:hypothetical protein
MSEAVFSQTQIKPQPFAQRAHLGTRAGGASSFQTQQLRQHVSCRGQQHAQLVGPKGTTAGPVDFKAMVQLFYPILDIAPTTVTP